ncbi:MAG: DHHW family protein [Clostridia bacterium]
MRLCKIKINIFFFKTDHHITSDGAYLLYLEFCKEANITPVTDYSKEEVTTSFLGSFDSKAQVANQKRRYNSGI